MVTAQGSWGNMDDRFNFIGAEIPVEGTGAYAGTGTAGYKIGPFKVTGDMAQNDRGAISVARRNGALRLDGGNEDGKGVAIGTEVIFDVGAMGTLTMETRVQRAVVTAGVVWAGFAGVNADDVAEVVTQSNGTTMTLTAAALAGFLLDSQYTATATWHCPFNGGSATAPTDSTVVVTGTSNARNKNSVAAVVAVAGEYDLLQMDIFTNGTVRWYINEILVQEQANAVSTSVDLACYVGSWGTASTVASTDVDYLRITGKRDWAR